MKKVYVAGAYSDNNVIGVLKNIGRGQAYATELFMCGFAPFTPWHDKEFVISNWYDEFDLQQFYNYSMAWLQVSDAVFIVPNCAGMKDWQESKGTLAEIEEAGRLSIPIFFDIEKLKQWRDVGY